MIATFVIVLSVQIAAGRYQTEDDRVAVSGSGMSVIRSEKRAVKSDEERWNYYVKSDEVLDSSDEHRPAVQTGESALAQLASGKESRSQARAIKASDLLSGLSMDQLHHLDDASLGAGACTYKQTAARSEKMMQDLRHHNVDCGTQYLTRWRFQEGTDEKFYVNYTCCDFGGAVTACEDKNTPYADGKNMKDFAKHSLVCPSTKGLVRFQMSVSGTQHRVDYKCCAPDAGHQVGDCITSKTPLTTYAPKNGLVALEFHNIKCKGGSTLSHWEAMKPYSNRDSFQVQRKCCEILIKMPSLGATWSNCHGSGDPHIVPFDRTSGCNDMTMPGVHWLVKNKYVWIQSRWCNTVNSDASSCTKSPAVTRDIMFGGPFLRENIFVISPDPRGCKWNRAAVSCSYSPDGVSMTSTKSGNSYTVSLPLSITVTATQNGGNWNGGQYFNWNVKSKKLPEGQLGHCGNYDGNTGNDYYNDIVTSAGHFISDTDADNLLHSSTAGKSEHKTAAGATVDDDCKGPAKTAAEATCKTALRKDEGHDLYDTFWKLCVFDVCVGGSTKFGEESADDMESFEEDVSSAAPVEYKIMQNISKAKLEKNENVCDSGYHLATPRSTFENNAILAAAAGVPLESSLVLGGMWMKDDEAWKWADGTSINPKCTYSGFRRTDEWRDPPDTNKVKEAGTLCMSMTNSLWHPCGEEPGLTADASTFTMTSATNTKQYTAVCQKDIKYSIVAAEGPVGARDACGAGMRLAMPKTVAQQEALFSKIHGIVPTDRVWIGGRFLQTAGGWFWEDGEPICGYMNWGMTQDELGLGSTLDDEDFMCMDVGTGKWVNCGPDKTNEFVVACESKPKPRTCIKGELKGKKQGLSVDGSETYSQYQNFCFYMGKAGKNCDETCKEQIGGACDVEGTQFLVDSLLNCRMVLNAFGGFEHSATGSGVVENNHTKCVYYEENTDRRVKLQKNPMNPFTTCTSAPNSKEHRICACSL